MRTIIVSRYYRNVFFITNLSRNLSSAQETVHASAHAPVTSYISLTPSLKQISCSLHAVKILRRIFRGLIGSSKSEVMPATRELVDELIASDGVVIFSKTYCPYCKMAKEVFDKLKQKYTAIELDSRDDADEIQTILGEITGARTVPRVFVKGECLGGGSDVKKLFETGELVKKL